MVGPGDRMKLYSFEIAGRRSIGAECNGQLVDLPAAYAALLQTRGSRPGSLKMLPSEMLEFIRAGEPALAAARDTLAFMAKRPAFPVGERATYLFSEAKVLAPIGRPGKILCSGINYRSHADENPGAKMPAEPFFFAKLPSCVIGPAEPIVRPKQTRQLDYEVEFA